MQEETTEETIEDKKEEIMTGTVAAEITKETIEEITTGTETEDVREVLHAKERMIKGGDE